ncbi:MAG: molybdenum ABC transporter ATP-binding protein [Magnetococcales bacterium]|nr:molybdenum ABC transporter ATP-binding protein [Magnetococcales bacterium]
MRLEAQLYHQQGAFYLDSQLSADLSGVTGLFGPSGSGKTTLLRCLSGLERAERGVVCFGDQIWQDESKGIFLPPHQRPVGVVFQESRLFDHLTIKENLQFGHQRAKKAQSRVCWDEVIDILELAPLLTRHPQRLSGGEQQRVAIGRTLLTGPQLLIMDEPLASMDHTGKKKILGFIHRVQTHLKLPILHVSHDMGEILQLADYLALMEKGRILATGPIHEMITRLDLPLAHRGDASTLLAAQVTEQELAYHLSHLTFGKPSQQLFIPNTSLSLGEQVRVRIFARDVSLTLEQPKQTSILNHFPAKVVEIMPENPAQSMVKLSVSGSPILSRITKKSLESLGIVEGLSVIAQVKSIALER